MTLKTTQHHCSFEGMYVNTGGTQRAYESYSCTFANGLVSYVAFINDISINNLQAADGNDCGQPSTTVPTTVGTDYMAVVGMIAQNSAKDPVCLAAIDIVGPGVLDTNAGTHFFVNGSFSFSNANASCTGVSDTEGFMIDSVDVQ